MELDQIIIESSLITVCPFNVRGAVYTPTRRLKVDGLTQLISYDSLFHFGLSVPLKFNAVGQISTKFTNLLSCS